MRLNPAASTILTVHTVLHSLAWFACIGYSTIPLFWLMIHPFVKFWRARRRNPFTVLLPLWIVLWVITALITAPRHRFELYSTSVAWLPAAGLLAVGIRIYRSSGSGFSWSQLAGIPEIRASNPPGKPLAAKGIRAHVRHPIYLAHLCEMLAWSLGSGLAVCYCLTAFAIITGAAMIALEERELTQRFGADYTRYKNNVPAVFPRWNPYNP